MIEANASRENICVFFIFLSFCSSFPGASVLLERFPAKEQMSALGLDSVDRKIFDLPDEIRGPQSTDRHCFIQRNYFGLRIALRAKPEGSILAVYAQDKCLVTLAGN